MSVSDLPSRVARLSIEVKPWTNCFLESIIYSSSPEGDDLQITIERENDLQLSVLKVGTLRMVAIDKPDSIDQCFIDEVRVRLITGGTREPFGAGYFEDRRDFVRLTLTGPASLDVVFENWWWG